MAGNLTFFGEVTIGACLPIANGMFAAVVAQLQAQLAGAVALSAQLKVRPPTLAAQLDVAIALVAALRAGIVLGLPGIDFQVTACATLIASLEAKIAVLAGFPLGTAGVFAYAYDGSASSYGPTVGSVVGSGLPGGRADDHINALIFATSIPATWAALGGVFIK